MSGTPCTACGQTTPDSLPLCARCATGLGRELAAVPGVVADLAVAAARLDRMTSGRVGGRGSETPLPIRPDIRARLDALDGELLGATRALLGSGHAHLDATSLRGLRAEAQAARATRTTREVPPRHGIGPARLVEVLTHPAELSMLPVTAAEMCALLLGRHLTALRSHPAALELHDGITDAIAGARMAMDRRDVVYAGPCKACGTDLWVERDPHRPDHRSPTATCWACRAEYDTRDLDAFLLQQVADKLATREEALGFIETYTGQRVPDGTWRSWRSRGQLQPAGWRRDGQDLGVWIARTDTPLFRVGDVIGLAKRTPHTPRLRTRSRNATRRVGA